MLVSIKKSLPPVPWVIRNQLLCIVSSLCEGEPVTSLLKILQWSCITYKPSSYLWHTWSFLIWPLISEHSLRKAKTFVIPREKPHKDHSLCRSYFCNLLAKIHFPMSWPGWLLIHPLRLSISIQFPPLQNYFQIPLSVCHIFLVHRKITAPAILYHHFHLYVCTPRWMREKEHINEGS